MHLHVGQASLQGKFARYLSRFNFLELRADVGTLPRPPRLREWRELAPANFSFSVLSPKLLAKLPDGPEADKAWTYWLKAADALDARWVALETAATITPGRQGREAVSSALTRLLETGRQVAWEPRGPWSDEAAAQVIADQSVHLIRDLRQSDAPPSADGVVYTRVRALGLGGRLSMGVGDILVDRLSSFAEAYVSVDGASAFALKKQLIEELGGDFDPAEHGVEFDDELESDADLEAPDSTPGAEDE